MADYDSMEYRIYTHKSELDKAVHTLEGIIRGISIDDAINQSEIEELKNWCSLHSNYKEFHPFNELIPLIEKSISDNYIDEEERKDILWVCNNIKSDNVYYDMVTSDLQRLQGLLYGVIADNIINDEEINGLKDWLNQNAHLLGSYPYDEVYSLITSILSDGKIDDSERETLKIFFSEFIDLKESYNINKNEIEELKKTIKIGGICVVSPEIRFDGNNFCFTGASSRMKRKDIQTIIESTGAIFNDTVKKETNYLIIGDEGNPCWAFSCYGRKVEKAIEMRKKGNSIIIIHENDFWNAFQNNRAS